MARLAFADALVEKKSPDGDWERLDEGGVLKTGDRIRTGPGCTARIAFPWMNLLVGSSTVLWIPPSRVLSTVLEEGRVEQRASGGRDVIKLKTAEALVRGAGHVVVRRNGEGTGVVVFDGRFRVEGSGKVQNVAQGHGSVVSTGRPPASPVMLAAPPTGLSPAADPVYVKKGDTVTLTWRAETPRHHLQVLRIDNDEVLMDRDVDGAPVSLQIPWPGTFRWRVSVRDHLGLEGLPSREGYFCVVDAIASAPAVGQAPSSLDNASSTSRRTVSSGSDRTR